MRILFTLVLTLTALPARADVEPMCSAPREVDMYQLLRRLSLDLRGKSPTLEEYQALETAGTLTPQAVHAMLGTDDFRLAMRRYHEALFWPNTANVRLNAQPPGLVTPSGESAMRSASAPRANTYRGDSTTGCGDYQQTSFDPGFPGQYRPFTFQTLIVNGKTVRQEGWRWVTPYWAPDTQVKVCAYDAQETVASGTVSCASSDGPSKQACGCGPNLKNCFSGTSAAGAVQTRINASFREQLNLAVDEVTVGGQPYTDLVLSTRAKQNGAIAFFKKNLAAQSALNLTYNVADPEEPIADRAFTDDTWLPTDRGGQHAGVTTLPAYLLRFQTDRSRANRWRINFLCEHFIPPDVLRPQAGCSTTSSDLTTRCNCQYCHSTLEPLAAHFGSFAEAGTTSMVNNTTFPKQKAGCAGSSSAFCNRFYVTAPDAHRAGWLMPLQFADVHPEYEAAYDAGPRALAQKAIDDGSLARCTVQKVFRYFVKRDMRASGAQVEELDLLHALSEDFVAHHYDFPWLVEQVVSLPQYRRVR